MYLFLRGIGLKLTHLIITAERVTSVRIRGYEFAVGSPIRIENGCQRASMTL